MSTQQRPQDQSLEAPAIGLDRSDWCSEPILLLRQINGAPYKFQFHISDEQEAVGHMAMFGPTTAGETEMPESTQQRPQDQSAAILGAYFAMQRVLFGAYSGEYLAERGWCLTRHMMLFRILADGCHNLAEIAGGLWCGHQLVPESKLRDALSCECQWLYEKAKDDLIYPAVWQQDSRLDLVWRRFWDAVAAPLDLPSVYGQPWEEVETQEHALKRLRLEAESRGLLRYPSRLGRLFGLDAALPWEIEATEFARHARGER